MILHAMAAGYDLSSQTGFDRFVQEYEEEVGWEWLVGMHINDSMGPANATGTGMLILGRVQLGWKDSGGL